MYRVSKNLFYKISSIKQSLRTLQLNVPTTKTQIKKKYLMMAKKYHPDSASEQPNQQTQKVKAKINQQKNQAIKKQLQQKFININKAYQYLRQLSQEQINTNKDRDVDGSARANPQRQQERRARMSTQQIKRKQSYDYFNRKFQQQNMNEQFNPTNSGRNRKQQTQIRGQKKPLYKSVPELFVGFLLLALILGDWSYRVYKKNKAQGNTSSEYEYRKQGYTTVKRNPGRDQYNRNPYASMNHNFVFKQGQLKQQKQ